MVGDPPAVNRIPLSFHIYHTLLIQFNDDTWHLFSAFEITECHVHYLLVLLTTALQGGQTSMICYPHIAAGWEGVACLRQRF